MYNHEPENYLCPFCELIKGHNTERNNVADIVWQDNDTAAFVAPKWFVNNEGHTIVIPKKHVENIYDISEKLIGKVYATAKLMALAMRATYDCTGTSTRQHNEPDGGQDVWHFHVHVFARYKDDRLYQNHDKKRFVTSEEKQIYVKRLKEYFTNLK